MDSSRVVGTELDITAVFTVGLPSDGDNQDVDTNPANDMATVVLPVEAITDPQLVL